MSQEQADVVVPVNPIIFWSYDWFPFVLGGQATGTPKIENTKTGVRVAYRVDSYGKSFYADYIAPDPAQAWETKLALDYLRTEYDRAKAKLLEDYKRKALEIAPWLKTFPDYKDLK